MNDEDVVRLADIVSDRVFKELSKFLDVLESVVRENEQLTTKVRQLEEWLFSPDEDAEDDDDDGYEDVPPDEVDGFFDVESAWEPTIDEDDSKPTFD
jgi:hypothetical protein